MSGLIQSKTLNNSTHTGIFYKGRNTFIYEDISFILTKAPVFLSINALEYIC